MKLAPRMFPSDPFYEDPDCDDPYEERMDRTNLGDYEHSRKRKRKMMLPVHFGMRHVGQHPVFVFALD